LGVAITAVGNFIEIGDFLRFDEVLVEPWEFLCYFYRFLYDFMGCK
jgi:hypothetical protein